MNEFKHTEIGLTPEDWEVVKLGEVLYPDRRKLKHREYDGSIPIVEKIQFDTGEVILRNKKQTRTDLYVGKKGRLLTSKINFHQGAVAIINNDGEIAATTHYEIYGVNKYLGNIKFLWYYFRSRFFKEIFYNEIKFAGFKKEANYRFIKNFKIPLPPLSEQQKIARVLDKIQHAIEIQDRIIEQARNIKKSLMQKLFTEGLNGEEQKETEIGLIPKSWKIVRLGEVVEFTRKPRNLRIRANDEVPFIPMELIPDDSKYAMWETKKYSKISSGTFVFKDDIIVAKITPSFENGKQAILINLLTNFGYATTEILAFHPKNDKVLREFIFEYLRVPKIKM